MRQKMRQIRVVFQRLMTSVSFVSFLILRRKMSVSFPPYRGGGMRQDCDKRATPLPSNLQSHKMQFYCKNKSITLNGSACQRCAGRMQDETWSQHATNCANANSMNDGPPALSQEHVMNTGLRRICRSQTAVGALIRTGGPMTNNNRLLTFAP